MMAYFTNSINLKEKNYPAIQFEHNTGTNYATNLKSENNLSTSSPHGRKPFITSNDHELLFTMS